jgi:hypothetical protein
MERETNNFNLAIQERFLESSRQLQQDILNHGLDAAYLYFEDVDGDWLENWDDDYGESSKLYRTFSEDN